MAEVDAKELAKHVARLLGVEPVFVCAEHVKERFKGRIVWEGSVSVFSVDHPEADTCYAWSSQIEGSERRKFYAVLGKPPIDSAEAGVRAAIVADHRASQ